MPYVIDLSGTPYGEECAQVGRDPTASARSHEEAQAYRAALIAVCGSPPKGYALCVNPNAHDFGTYYTVQLQCPDEDGQEGRTYEALVEQGIDQWNAAMMPAPYAYYPNGSWTALDVVSPAGAAIESALVASRPNSAGRFGLPLFQQIHERLRAAYPVEAARTDARIELIASVDPVDPR